MALEIAGIKDIIIVQNKIDLVSKEEVMKNYKQIKSFVKGTIAENSPIIPVSAQQKVNIDILIKTIQENFKSKELDEKKDPIFLIARSFDVNKPGSLIKNIQGGVLGGSLKQGILKVGDELELRPGLKKEKEGKIIWQPVETKIVGLEKGRKKVKELTPRGSSGILTKLDPSIVKSDSLVGNIAGIVNKMPEVWDEIKLKPKLLERVVGSKQDLKTESIRMNENLMLNVNATVTLGVVTKVENNSITTKLKRPICANIGDRITISRMLGSRWRLIGHSKII
jgi:translation initiation factor 2 subunit 3